MRIALFCPNKPLSHPNPSGDLMIARGLKQAIERCGHECREIVQVRTRWFWRSATGWKAVLAATPQAWRRLKQFQPHVWLTYHTYYKSPDTIGPWLSRLHNIPYVLVQPMYSTRRRKTPGTRWGFYLNRLALRAAEHVFINNLNDLQSLCRIFPENRITYLPPGIDPEDFKRNERAGGIIRQRLGISETTFLVLTVARFRPGVKTTSLEYLLGSLRLLKSDIPDHRLLVVGDGPMENHLRSLAEDWVPRRVIFAGRVDRQAMPGYYSAADVFVFPGIGESLGMVYLEAQACGLPVIALRSPGVAQVVPHDRSGILVPDDQGRSMASAIERLMMEPDTRRRLAESGPEYVESERNCRRNYLELARRLERLAR